MNICTGHQNELQIKSTVHSVLSWQLNLHACESLDELSNCYFPVSVIYYVKGVAICWKMLKHFLSGFSKCRSSSSFTCLLCGFEIACHYSQLKCRFAINFHSNCLVMNFLGTHLKARSVDWIIDISGLYSLSLFLCWIQNVQAKGKGKAVPLQAWSGPEGPRKLRSPSFMTTAQDGGKVSLTHRPPLPQGNTPVTHFY